MPLRRYAWRYAGGAGCGSVPVSTSPWWWMSRWRSTSPWGSGSTLTLLFRRLTELRPAVVRSPVPPSDARNCTRGESARRWSPRASAGAVHANFVACAALRAAGARVLQQRKPRTRTNGLRRCRHGHRTLLARTLRENPNSILHPGLHILAALRLGDCLGDVTEGTDETEGIGVRSSEVRSREGSARGCAAGQLRRGCGPGHHGQETAGQAWSAQGPPSRRYRTARHRSMSCSNLTGLDEHPLMTFQQHRNRWTLCAPVHRQ